MPPRTVPRVPVHPVVAPQQSRAAGVAGKAEAEANAARQNPEQTQEQKQAAHLRTAKTIITAPVQLEFLGMAAGGVTGWFGLHRTRAAIRMGLKSTASALRETTLGTTPHFKANWFKAAATEAQEVADDGVKRYAKKKKFVTSDTANVSEVLKDIDRTKVKGVARVQEWADRAKSHAASLAGEAEVAQAAALRSTTVAGTQENAGKASKSFADSGIGQRVHSAFDRFAKHRMKAAGTSHTAAFAEAQQALSAERHPVMGAISKASEAVGKLFGRTPAETQGMQHLHEIVGKLDSQDVRHLTDVKAQLEALVKNNAFKGEAEHRAGSIAKQLQKMLGNAKAMETYGSGGMSALRKIANRIPLLNVLLLSGFVMGAGAILVTGHGESKESKAEFQRLKDQLPDSPDSEFMRSLKAVRKSESKTDIEKAAVRMVGEAADAAMWALPHGGGFALMSAQMLPQGIEMLLQENPMLGALKALAMADKGRLEIIPSKRIELIAQVIGSMETVVKNGGPYNRLAKAMAVEMQERGFKEHDIVAVLGHDTSFKAFAAEVSAKQQAEAAPAATQVKAAAPVAAAPMIHAGPTTRVGVGAAAAQHKGKGVNNHQLAMAGAASTVGLS